jgi:NAD+ diphosphatase
MPGTPRPPNIFAGPYLDRTSRPREDTQWLEELGPHGDALLVPVWQLRNLIDPGGGTPTARLLEWREAAPQVTRSDDLILLGEFRGRLCFAVEYTGDAPPRVPPEAEFHDLRGLGGTLPGDEAGLLAYARAMVHWRGRHRFCGSCGAPTASSRSGHLLKCTRCGMQQFPRIDPAIIVLVSLGEGDDERALLGRQAIWPPGRYSTIAGFVEPGESLEDAVIREVLEETGIEATTPAYHSSQPWPFPSSLMLGFTARARTIDIACRDGELEDARWFSREDLKAGKILLPPRQSISYRLIEDWLQADVRPGK